VVQYAAGHLYRWVKNGFLTDKKQKERATREQLRQWEKEKDIRWENSVASFTTLEELQKTADSVTATIAKGKKRKLEP
jgi:hypothetical protein